jgi:hypothetical protein
MPMKAEVMRWVYSTGTSKPVVPQPTKRSGFFSSLSLFGITTPQRVPTPLPPVKTAELLEIRETNVTLTIFSAEVDVKLDKKMTTELYRSTKKNPPSKLKYELIYVCDSSSSAWAHTDHWLEDCQRRIRCQPRRGCTTSFCDGNCVSGTSR